MSVEKPDLISYNQEKNESDSKDEAEEGDKDEEYEEEDEGLDSFVIFPPKIDINGKSSIKAQVPKLQMKEYYENGKQRIMRKSKNFEEGDLEEEKLKEKELIPENEEENEEKEVKEETINDENDKDKIIVSLKTEVEQSAKTIIHLKTKISEYQTKVNLTKKQLLKAKSELELANAQIKYLTLKNSETNPESENILNTSTVVDLTRILINKMIA